jgi:hypothetical protein
LKAFVVNQDKIKEKNFRFCGKEIEQYDDFSVMITCKDATEGIGPIKYHQAGRQVDAYATEAEVAQLRSVIGSLGWIARQSRPDLSYSTSKKRPRCSMQGDDQRSEGGHNKLRNSAKPEYTSIPGQ